MPLSTSAEIKADALFRAGEKTDGTSDLDSQAIVYLNRSYRSLYMGGSEFEPSINEVWWWLKREANFILDSVIDSGTVSVGKNSNSLTFTASPTPTIESNVSVGWFFKTDKHSDVFRVSAHADSSTTATLDSVYTGETDTAASYRLMKLQYTIDNSAIKLIAPMTGYKTGFKIYGMSLDRMEFEYPLANISGGIPTVFADVDEDTVRFNKYASVDQGDLIRIDYDYIVRPDDLADDSNTPLVPLQYRHILSDMTLYFLFNDKGDEAAIQIGLQAKAGIRAMARENANRWAKIGRMGKIVPRQGHIGRAGLRTGAGLRIR